MFVYLINLRIYIYNTYVYIYINICIYIYTYNSGTSLLPLIKKTRYFSYFGLQSVGDTLREIPSDGGFTNRSERVDTAQK